MSAPPVPRKVVECVENVLEPVLRTTDEKNRAAWNASLPKHIEAKPFTSDRARHGLNQHCVESTEPKWGMGWAKDVRHLAAGTREVPLKDAGVGRLTMPKKAKPPVSEEDRLYAMKIEEDVQNPPMSSLPPPKAISEARTKAARVAAPPKPKKAVGRPPAYDPPREATEAQTRAIRIASNLQRPPPEQLQKLFADNLLYWDEFKVRKTYIGAYPDEEARNSIRPCIYTERSLIKIMGELAEAKERFGDARNALDDDKIVEERAAVQRLEEQVRQTVEELRSRQPPAPLAESGKWEWEKCLRVHDGDAFGSVIGRPEVRDLLLRCGLEKYPTEPFWMLDAEYRQPALNSFCAIALNPEQRGRRPPGWKQLAPARRTAKFFSLRPDNGFGPLVGPKTHFQRAPERVVPDGVTTCHNRTIKFDTIVPRSDADAWEEAYDMELESQAAFLAKRKRAAEAAEAAEEKEQQAEKRRKEAAEAEAEEQRRAEPRLAKHV